MTKQRLKAEIQREIKKSRNFLRQNFSNVALSDVIDMLAENVVFMLNSKTVRKIVENSQDYPEKDKVVSSFLYQFYNTFREEIDNAIETKAEEADSEGVNATEESGDSEVGVDMDLASETSDTEEMSEEGGMEGEGMGDEGGDEVGDEVEIESKPKVVEEDDETLEDLYDELSEEGIDDEIEEYSDDDDDEYKFTRVEDSIGDEPEQFAVVSPTMESAKLRRRLREAKLRRRLIAKKKKGLSESKNSSIILRRKLKERRSGLKARLAELTRRKKGSSKRLELKSRRRRF